MIRAQVHPVSPLPHPVPAPGRSNPQGPPLHQAAPHHFPSASALPSLRSGTSQWSVARGKMTRKNLSSPCALWHPHFPPAHPTPWGCITTSHHLWGWEAAELGWGHRTSKTDLRELCPAVSSWDTCQRRIPLTSAFIGHTHCLWVSSQFLISLGDRASNPTPGPLEMAAPAEEKERPPPTHTQDFWWLLDP